MRRALHFDLYTSSTTGTSANHHECAGPFTLTCTPRPPLVPLRIIMRRALRFDLYTSSTTGTSANHHAPGPSLWLVHLVHHGYWFVDPL